MPVNVLEYLQGLTGLAGPGPSPRYSPNSGQQVDTIKRAFTSVGGRMKQTGKQMWDGMDTLDRAALTTSPVPIVGDVVGAVNDVRYLAEDPSMANAGFALAGLLPMVPSLGMVKAAKKVTGTKVVDDKGEPMRVYHGTNAEFSEFKETGKTDAGWHGPGFYFYPKELWAKGYGKNIKEVYLDIKNPAIRKTRDRVLSKEDSQKLRTELEAAGHDGVMSYDEDGTLADIVAFHPHQIKKYLTKDEMIKRGADGHLSKAIESEIPISKIDGLEPTPASAEGVPYVKGRKIDQPIEVSYDRINDKYMLYSGNHRVTQATINGDATIPAFIEPDGDSVGDLTRSADIPSLKDIRPPKENLQTVTKSLSNNAKVVGDETVPIDTLKGGATVGKVDQDRVEHLADIMGSEGSFIERLIVDDAGNVIEGQHRLDALRMLGAKEVPILRIKDYMRDFPARVGKDMQSAQKLQSDHVNQLSAHLAEIWADEGGVVAEVMKYPAPQGYEAAWSAGIKSMAKKKKK